MLYLPMAPKSISMDDPFSPSLTRLGRGSIFWVRSLILRVMAPL